MPKLIVRIRAKARKPSRLVVAIRPYNPEGIQFIENIGWIERHQALQINRNTHVVFNRQPEKLAFSNYEGGDVVHCLNRARHESAAGIVCPVGMATLAALFPMENNETLNLGYMKRSRRLLSGFFKHQTSSGHFKSQEGEWDSNGQVLWLLGRYHLLSGVPLPDFWITGVEKGASWIWRKRIPDSSGKTHAGLMPAGFSAEHLGPNHFYYWDAFWSLAGLESAARLLGLFSGPGKEKHWQNKSLIFQRKLFENINRTMARRDLSAISASPYRRMGAGAVGSLVADYPLRITESGDLRIMGTMNYLMKHCLYEGGFFQDMIHSRINVYLTLSMAHTLLRANNHLFSQLIETAASSGSSTGQWPEAIHPVMGLGAVLGENTFLIGITVFLLIAGGIWIFSRALKNRDEIKIDRQSHGNSQDR